jgi:mannose-6-phosphate isomerase-like protein (cupin superfamily)
MSTIFKRTAMVLLGFIAGYLAIGYLFHLVIFPEKKPDVDGWFKPGQEFYSKAEGFRQRVIKQEGGFVYCHTEIEPFAGGPPKHVHTGFDEVFEVENGELSVWVDGTIKKLRAGEVLTIPKGTPHKPYNETVDTIRIKGAIAFPEKFAFNLVQVYADMDKRPDLSPSADLAFQMFLFQRSGFDAYMVEGPPVGIQQLMAFLLTPALRLAGYKTYYSK